MLNFFHPIRQPVFQKEQILQGKHLAIGGGGGGRKTANYFFRKYTVPKSMKNGMLEM
jgi:hypothetical protein